MLNYTKGEWGYTVYEHIEPATMPAMLYSKDEDEEIDIATFEIWDNAIAEQQANARLIAVAPKLYEACKELIEHRKLHQRSEHPKANMFCTECSVYENKIEQILSELK